MAAKDSKLTRKQLIALLNEDLEREYQAIIAYVVYSQVLKGAEYMNIADELQVHAGEELQHAITLANQIDYLGGMPATTPKPVKTSEKATDMLKFDLNNENETIRNYRERVRQCEELGEYAHGRANPPDPGPRTRSPDRPRDGARRRRAGRHVAEGTRANRELAVTGRTSLPPERAIDRCARGGNLLQ